MSFHVTRHHRSNRHRPCEGCGFHIAKGEVYAYSAGSGSDGFYRFTTHTECAELRSEIYLLYDYGEGLPVYIPEIYTEYGEPADAREDLDKLRGRFPHAVCRTEHRLRNWLASAEEND